MSRDFDPERLRRSAVERKSIFLSYRRSDSQVWTGRLADDLRDYYGRDSIYRDLDSTRGAQNYVGQLAEALARSQAVIAVIGPSWATTTDGRGERRLQDRDDLVRVELEVALNDGIAIVPVVVGGAVPPSSAQLPPSLATISRLQAQRLSDEDWYYDFGRLVETLERHGVHPVNSPEQKDAGAPARPARPRRFERTLQASRRRAYDAAVGAAQLLRYPLDSVDPQAAGLQFTAHGRAVSVGVRDVSAGRSTVVVEFGTISTGAFVGAAATSLVLAPPLALVAAAGAIGLRRLERRFAVGFLNNVQNVLEGREIGPDSALLPGVEEWRNRSREV